MVCDGAPDSAASAAVAVGADGSDSSTAAVSCAAALRVLESVISSESICCLACCHIAFHDGVNCMVLTKSLQSCRVWFKGSAFM